MAKNKTFLVLIGVSVFQILIIILLLLYISLLIKNTKFTETQISTTTPPQNLPENIEMVLDVDESKPNGLPTVEF